MFRTVPGVRHPSGISRRRQQHHRETFDATRTTMSITAPLCRTASAGTRTTLSTTSQQCRIARAGIRTSMSTTSPLCRTAHAGTRPITSTTSPSSRTAPLLTIRRSTMSRKHAMTTCSNPEYAIPAPAIVEYAPLMNEPQHTLSMLAARGLIPPNVRADGFNSCSAHRSDLHQWRQMWRIYDRQQLFDDSCTDTRIRITSDNVFPNVFDSSGSQSVLMRHNTTPTLLSPRDEPDSCSSRNDLPKLAYTKSHDIGAGFCPNSKVTAGISAITFPDGEVASSRSVTELVSFTESKSTKSV